jgi:Family of unknown function (DUF6335)
MKPPAIRRLRHGRRRPRPVLPPVTEDGRGVRESLTAVAAEALRTGVGRGQARRCREAIPHEDVTIRVGDPDDLALANEYVGEETPGGTTPTPDQNDVDRIGRAYGLQEEGAGALRSSAEIMARRDRRRAELQPPRRPKT